MQVHKACDIALEAMGEERVKRVEREAHAEALCLLIDANLKALREAVGVTQSALAEAAGISQAELSRAEAREDHLVSTLRRYVEALGGELEILARFGDKTVKLHGV
jgi:DNA-binding transcriptional regulator YiaG